MNKISQIYSTLFYVGYFKYMPGTIGSFISIILIIFLNELFKDQIFIILFIVLAILSLIFIDNYSKLIKKDDAKEIVIDEFLGIYLIIIFTNNYNLYNDYIKFFLIFIFFRFFDIIKPFPANWIDKNIKNSFGIILDDLIAGIYTIIILFFINAFI